MLWEGPVDEMEAHCVISGSIWGRGRCGRVRGRISRRDGRGAGGRFRRVKSTPPARYPIGVYLCPQLTKGRVDELVRPKSWAIGTRRGKEANDGRPEREPRSAHPAAECVDRRRGGPGRPQLLDGFADSETGIEPGQCAAQGSPMRCTTIRSIEELVQLPRYGWCRSYDAAVDRKPRSGNECGKGAET